MTCNGDNTEICGGPSRLSFYKVKPSGSSIISNSSSTKSSTSSTMSSTTSSKSSTSLSTSSTSSSATAKPTGPSVVQKAGAFSFQDCYTEATNGRALSGDGVAKDSMTVEACSTYCAGYSMMGVEYGRECKSQVTQEFPDLILTSLGYCGNSLNAGSVVATSGCSMVCNGDGTEYCGGPNRLNLYSLSKTSSSSTMSATSVTSKSSTSSQSVTSQSTSSRSSSSQSTSSQSTSSTATSTRSSTTSTVSSSSSVTSSSTSKTSSTSSTPAVATPTNFQNNANFTYTACYVEATSGRALSTLQMANDAMTVESCLKSCSAYTYVGLEYGRECWCANSIDSTAVKATAESQCNKKCSGDGSELCGGSSRLSLYTKISTVKPAVKAAFVANKAAVSSSATTSSSNTQSTSASSRTTDSSSKSSSTTTQSSTSSQTPSSTKSTLIPTPSQTVGSYVYLGCANQTSPLALVGMSQTSSDSMTNEVCQAYCLKNNYGLAATQDGSTCYCGNGLQSYSTVGHQSCKTPCSGNSTEICGGKDSNDNNYLSVWNSTSATIPTTTVKQVGYYTSQGCYSSTQSDTPILNGTIHSNPTGESVESCVGYCITKGYSIAGVKEGACYCDSALATTVKKEEISACNVPCAGNKREFCGASGKWSVYEKDPDSVDSSGVPTSMNQPNPATISAA